MSDDLTTGQHNTSDGDGKNTAGQAGAATPAATTAGERTFTQADLDRIVEQRLARERDAEKVRLEKAQRDADEQAKIKAGEIQSVAEQRAQRIAELEPKVTTLETTVQSRDELIEKLIKPRISALPDEFRALLPDGDIAQRVETLIKVEKAAEKAAATRTPGTSSGPRGAGGTQTVTVAVPRRMVGDGF